MSEMSPIIEEEACMTCKMHVILSGQADRVFVLNYYEVVGGKDLFFLGCFIFSFHLARGRYGK